jgi:UDP-N-acetylmuramate dehydrogenase
VPVHATIEIEENVSLKSMTSWVVGGSADFLARPRSIDELRDAVAWAEARSLPITVLSGGSNVLVSDRGVRGLTISLRKFSSAIVTIREATPAAQSASGDRAAVADAPGATNETSEARLEIECLSGTSKSELLKIFLKHKLEPALFLAGLPGDVGGGVVMNAGVSEPMKPREFNEFIDWFEVLKPDGGIRRYMRDEVEWAYRHCNGWQPGIITRVGLSWPLMPSADILDRVKAANKTRLTKQPLDMPSCGSVFKNPPGTSSGREVEAAGLKGFTVGGAQVSLKHANFIVNTGDATARDIDAVIKHVQAMVKAKTGIELKTEVVYLGDW